MTNFQSLTFQFSNSWAHDVETKLVIGSKVSQKIVFYVLDFSVSWWTNLKFQSYKFPANAINWTLPLIRRHVQDIEKRIWKKLSGKLRSFKCLCPLVILGKVASWKPLGLLFLKLICQAFKRLRYFKNDLERLLKKRTFPKARTTLPSIGLLQALQIAISDLS